MYLAGWSFVPLKVPPWVQWWRCEPPLMWAGTTQAGWEPAPWRAPWRAPGLTQPSVMGRERVFSQTGIGSSCHLQKITIFCLLSLENKYCLHFFVLKVAFLPQLWCLCSTFWCSSYAIFSKERFGGRVGTKPGPESLLVWCFLFHTGDVVFMGKCFMGLLAEGQQMSAFELPGHCPHMSGGVLTPNFLQQQK